MSVFNFKTPRRTHQRSFIKGERPDAQYDPVPEYQKGFLRNYGGRVLVCVLLFPLMALFASMGFEITSSMGAKQKWGFVMMHIASLVALPIISLLPILWYRDYRRFHRIFFEETPHESDTVESPQLTQEVVLPPWEGEEATESEKVALEDYRQFLK